MVGGHDAVLGEDEVERAAGLPPIELDCDGGVAVGVPLVNFVKSVQNVTWSLKRKVSIVVDVNWFKTLGPTLECFYFSKVD